MKRAVTKCAEQRAAFLIRVRAFTCKLIQLRPRSFSSRYCFRATALLCTVSREL